MIVSNARREGRRVGEKRRGKVKICMQCKHFECNGLIWYDQWCHAVQRDEAINPQTGEKCWKGKNDLGGGYFTDERFPHARDVNPKGECVLWEKGKPKSPTTSP